MFEQVTILLSFVYAIALTHLLSSASELIIERRRVRMSWLYLLWLVDALLILLNNWLSFRGLHAVKQWTMAQILLQFSLAFVQYFTCSTLLIRPRDGEPIDLGALFEQRRAMTVCAFIGVYAISMSINYIDRDIFFGRQPTDWILPNVVLLASLLPVVLAGWGPRWTQWLGGLALLATGVQFLVAYTVTN
jgi:hypothetical protein